MNFGTHDLCRSAAEVRSEIYIIWKIWAEVLRDIASIHAAWAEVSRAEDAGSIRVQ